MGTYRRKPTIIEAVQLCWKNLDEVYKLVGFHINPDNVGFHIPKEEASDTCGEDGPYLAFTARTTHGEEAIFRHGDWIIPDSKEGTFYPCKPDIFEATYEPYPIMTVEEN